MPQPPYTHLGGLRDVESFRRYLADHQIDIPCAEKLIPGAMSSLAQPIRLGSKKIGNRIAAQPMEGWDATSDGRPTELTFRRWERFGASGAKLIWGGEAVAVRHDGRANPRQLVLNAETAGKIAGLREGLIAAHREHFGSADDLVIGLQLTHSGRFARPNDDKRLESRILYHHPLLDKKYNLPADSP